MNAREYLSALHRCRCVVCLHMGQTQTTHGVAHHLESVRDENSHFAAVALCDDCHKLLHRLSRRAFEMRTKLTPIDMMALTIKQVVAL